MEKVAFFNRSFTLLDKPKYRWMLILFITGFSIFFINVFVPFNINSWYNDSGIQQFIRLSGFGIFGGLILVLSQFAVRNVFGVKSFNVGTFILWAIGELFLMTVFFVIYDNVWSSNFSRFLIIFPDTLRYTSLGILIPYSLALLFIAQVIKIKEVRELKRKSDLAQRNDELLDFIDEKGIVRFSVSVSQLLYFESADNYVFIYYILKNEIEKGIIRNSMKNVEKLVEGLSIIRCHRSFMINLKKIEFVDYKKSNCKIKLLECDTLIPVSRKYFPMFKPYPGGSNVIYP